MRLEQLIESADLDCDMDRAMLADALEEAGRSEEASLLRAGPADLFRGRLYAPFPGLSNVLGRGSHAGHDWVVCANRMAYRCGYVRVPAGHPWHGKGYDDVVAEVHGGLTYANGSNDGAWWVGFDCAHAGDAPDPDLPAEYRYPNSWGGDVVRTQEYVKAECRSLCEQAASA